MSKKYLYYFDEGSKAFNGDLTTMKNILGGKGAGLAEMTAAGMPVPQGFTITTDACTQYYADGEKINDSIQAEIMEYIAKLEKIAGKKFGDLENPLLVSVRSGARAFRQRAFGKEPAAVRRAARALDHALQRAVHHGRRPAAVRHQNVLLHGQIPSFW